MSTQKNINNLIKYFCDKWKLSNLRPIVYTSITNNYVVIAYSAKYEIDVVLKILVHKTNESGALKFFDGNGCVKLLDYDLEHNVLLLEHIKPGIPLKTMFPENDSKALECTAEVIKKLHSKNLIHKVKSFKTVHQWLELLSRIESKKIPEYLIQKAIRLSEELLTSKQEPYLLHGDLHHENILQFSSGWLAIDPKGVIGPLEYEVGRFIMNPIPDLLQQSIAKVIIKNRIDKFCKIFDFEKRRLIDWTFVQAILSACWAEQDKNEKLLNYFIKFAQTIENL